MRNLLVHLVQFAKGLRDMVLVKRSKTSSPLVSSIWRRYLLLSRLRGSYNLKAPQASQVYVPEIIHQQSQKVP